MTMTGSGTNSWQKRTEERFFLKPFQARIREIPDGCPRDLRCESGECWEWRCPPRLSHRGREGSGEGRRDCEPQKLDELCGQDGSRLRRRCGFAGCHIRTSSRRGIAERLAWGVRAGQETYRRIRGRRPRTRRERRFGYGRDIQPGISFSKQNTSIVPAGGLRPVLDQHSFCGREIHYASISDSGVCRGIFGCAAAQRGAAVSKIARCARLSGPAAGTGFSRTVNPFT